MVRTKLTPFVRKRISELIEQGMPPYRAAIAVGVTAPTFYRWRDLGERARENNGHGGENPYLLFVNEIEQSEARFIERNVARIDRAAEKDTENAKWMLERRYPSEFGKRVEVEIGASKVLLALQRQAQETVGYIEGEGKVLEADAEG